MNTIPNGFRPTDYIMAQHLGHEPDQPVASLDEARKISDATVILDGDYGGQVYATCPVKYLRNDITLQDLEAVCRKVSAWQWGEDQAADEDWSVTFAVKEIGSGVWGGMGGGRIIDGLWLHKKLCEESVQLIQSLIAKNKDPVSLP